MLNSISERGCNITKEHIFNSTLHYLLESVYQIILPFAKELIPKHNSVSNKQRTISNTNLYIKSKLKHTINNEDINIDRRAKLQTDSKDSLIKVP